VAVTIAEKTGDPTQPELAEHYGIGGFAELTTIRETGVETKMLRRWNDEIGDMIDPFKVKAA
jgi:hypothetical protein